MGADQRRDFKRRRHCVSALKNVYRESTSLLEIKKIANRRRTHLRMRRRLIGRFHRCCGIIRRTESTTITRTFLPLDDTPALSPFRRAADEDDVRARLPARLVSARGVHLAASYLIRRLSAALLSARGIVACTCSSWPTASEPLGITSLFRIFRCRRFPPSPRSRSLLFSRLFSLDQVLSARSLALLLRSYSGSEGNLRPRGGKMDEGLAQRCYECRRNQSLQRPRPRAPSLSVSPSSPVSPI